MIGVEVTERGGQRSPCLKKRRRGGGAKEAGEGELRTESKVLTSVSVSQGQAAVDRGFQQRWNTPSSFAEKMQTPDSSSNCRATDLLSADSDATCFVPHVTITG